MLVKSTYFSFRDGPIFINDAGSVSGVLHSKLRFPKPMAVLSDPIWSFLILSRLPNPLAVLSLVSCFGPPLIVLKRETSRSRYGNERLTINPYLVLSRDGSAADIAQHKISHPQHTKTRQYKKFSKRTSIFEVGRIRTVFWNRIRFKSTLAVTENHVSLNSG